MTIGPAIQRLLVAAALAIGAAGLIAQESPNPPVKDDAKTVPGQTPPDGQGQVPKPTEEGDVRTPAQPSAEDIIRAFQKHRPENLPVRSQGPAASPQAAAGPLMREGEYVNNRAGRLVHEGEWWVFDFESESPDTPQPLMRLLPNLQLERIARESEAAGDGAVFVVSGEVTIFESQNYLLLRKALRRRDMGNLAK